MVGGRLLKRARCLAASWLAVAVLLAGDGGAAAGTPGLDTGTPGDAEVLAGRLGGTLASFTQQYGAPIAGTPEDGATFDVPGYGAVFVQFALAPDPTRPNRVTTHAAPDSPAQVITLRSPRPATVPATASDPADWSLAEAYDRARALLPADAAVGDVVPIGDDAAGATCRSAALARAFGADGRCRVTFVRPTPATVSYATLALAPRADEEPADRLDPCGGFAAWAHDAGARMTAARALLDRLGAVADDDLTAAAILREVGAAFAVLAAAQQSAAAPAAAAAANALLVDAFAAYARATVRAADGIERGDADQIEAAIRDLEAASAGIREATVALAAAATRCGLEIGTPAGS